MTEHTGSDEDRTNILTARRGTTRCVALAPENHGLSRVGSFVKRFDVPSQSAVQVSQYLRQVKVIVLQTTDVRYSHPS